MKSPTALHTLGSPGSGRASYGFDRDDLHVKRRRRPAEGLRRAIDCMPLATRRAMRDALEVNAIIVGAYTDRDGGVCPMLAAHRNGGRTGFAAFARAWDRYTRAGKAPRRATEREVRTLSAMLDASLAMEDAGSTSLGRAIAEHRTAQCRDRATTAPKRPAGGDREPRETRERDRGPELSRRHGWAWLRPFRRLDDYERAVGELEDGPARRATGEARQPA